MREVGWSPSDCTVLVLLGHFAWSDGSLVVHRTLGTLATVNARELRHDSSSGEFGPGSFLDSLGFRRKVELAACQLTLCLGGCC